MNAKEWGPATVLGVLLTVAAAVIGGIVVLTSDDLTFQEYLIAMAGFAVGNGLVSIGRGIGNAGRARAEAESGK